MHLNYTNCQILSPHCLMVLCYLGWCSLVLCKIVLLTSGVTSPAGLVLHCLSSLKGPLGRCLSEYNKVDESR